MSEDDTGELPTESTVEKGVTLAQKEKELMAKLAKDREAKAEVASAKSAGLTPDNNDAVKRLGSFRVTLPSRGALYDGKLPDGQILIRPLTTREEQILFAPFGDGVQKISSMINNCVVSREVEPDDLLLIDRFYILLALRIDAYGTNYKIDAKCASCGSQFKHNIDLKEDLDMDYMDEDADEFVSVTLPKNGDKVLLRHLRGRDEVKISKHVKKVRLESTDPSDPSYSFRQALQIVSVNGEEKPLKALNKYVQGLQVADMTAMRLAMQEVEAGVDTKLVVDCLSCGHVNTPTLPFDLEFFRPSSL